MIRAWAVCCACGKEFVYFQRTKPRSYCSAVCEHERTRYLDNRRRYLKRQQKRAARIAAGH